MNHPLRALFLTLVIALLLARIPARAAVGVSVSPAIISNTYTGQISINITGLTNFQPVKVETYLDLNGNGVIDPGEPLIDTFKLTESGAVVVGGITNVCIPYDSNPATNAITATLNFAPPSALDNIVGQKIYRVIGSPGTAFTPVTATITVTNALLNQFVSGIVYSNDGVTPLPNAVVVALTVTNQNYVAAAVADANGHYNFSLSPGYYFLLPALPGYYTDQNHLPQVNLTNGLSVTNNLTLTNSATTISGTVYDAVSSNSLAGIFLQAQSGSLFEIVFTDTNGNYTINCTSNNWKFKISAERLSRRGYLAPQNTALVVDAAAGSVTNANVGLYHGNAIFYGQVTISNQPVPNVAVECNDDNQILVGKGLADANGNYAAPVLVNTNILPAGVSWNCSLSSGGEIGLYNNFIFNETNSVFATNQAVPLPIVGLPVTTTLTGRLLNSLGAPISSVGVGANATINGLNYTTAYVDTDAGGGYTIGLASGIWYVNANCCGNDGLGNQGYYQASQPMVTVPPANPTANVIVYPANQPAIAQAQLVNHAQFDFNLYGVNGYNYTVQTTTNLAKTNWSTLVVVSNLPGSPYLIQDTQVTNSARFYRAFQGP